MSSNGEFPQLLEAKVRGFAMEDEDATKTGVRFKKQTKIGSHLSLTRGWDSKVQLKHLKNPYELLLVVSGRKWFHSRDRMTARTRE